jgi:tyrosine-protein phosphatase SIW14
MSSYPRFPRTSVLAFVLALSIAGPSAAQAPAVTGSVKAAINNAISKVRIDNFGQVNKNYYRGAMPKGTDFTALAAIGVKTLVDLTDDDQQLEERSLAESAGMKFFRIPLNTRVEPTAAEIASFLKIVSDPANQPVYVHCVGGRHRTGVMTAAYRMTQEGWTAEQAFKEMKKYKFGADFLHPEFKKFVYAFRASFLPALAVPAESGGTK